MAEPANTQLDWNDLRHFLALARLGSVRAAGASLHVSHSTVARRVEALEVRLGARLFDRSRDGYTLTGAGRQMLPGAERIEREMCTLERGLLGQDERLMGRVSLTCCDNYVSDLVLQQLTPFCAKYPDIELSFKTDSRPFDLSKREADIAIRTLAMGAKPPEFLIGQRLAPVWLASYVGVAHQERLDPERNGAESRWLSFEDRAQLERMTRPSSYPNLPAWGSFSSIELLVQAARVGLGITLLPTYVGDREPELCRLIRPDLRQVADLWLVSHPDLRENARFGATRAALSRAFQTLSPLFRGDGWSKTAPGRPEIAPDRGPPGGIR